MTLQHPPSPGWYDDARGQRRWWDGLQWSSPAPLADLRQLAPPISAPSAPPMLDRRMMRDTTISPATSQTVVHHVVHPPAKDLAATYLLLIFLGTLGAHRFYLGRTGTAIAMLALALVGGATSWLFVGLPLVFAVGVWWFVDLLLVPGMVREENQRAVMAASPSPYYRGWPQP